MYPPHVESKQLVLKTDVEMPVCQKEYQSALYKSKRVVYLLHKHAARQCVCTSSSFYEQLFKMLAMPP